MFTANFYSCTADSRQRDKTSALTLIASAVPLSPTALLDIMSPQLIIDYAAALTAANYAYLPEFGRWYFLAPPKIQTGKRIIFDGNIDVLMSYRAQLLSVPATVIRNEKIGANYAPDNQLPIDPNRVDIVTALSTKSFKNPGPYQDYANWQAVLITGKGGISNDSES